MNDWDEGETFDVVVVRGQGGCVGGVRAGAATGA